MTPKSLACALLLAVGCSAGERPCLMVLTDIGGDPDDQQSMVRLMVYANEFAIEGLIAISAGIPGQIRAPVTRPDLIKEIVGRNERPAPRQTPPPRLRPAA